MRTIPRACCNAGDDEGNLLWRLQNGELYQRNPPKVAVLELTGNNDLSDADCRFSKEDIDAAVPGAIQRCAYLRSPSLWPPVMLGARGCYPTSVG